ncbi:DUF4097 family beta strand repeat-containing protein [Actinomadura rugatobispora]|uniref:DUF4097 domain-containing protein n=1 Tax=Actinomadura rugatobispora TaxID=1994 RepID=A0ABW1A4Z8_9ACTN|nr:DUF4097 family beta strand repeat-containing protein [Actinomadura rugatobispora]
MPVFATPAPILASVQLTAGDVIIEAGDRADTVVEVRPSDGGRDTDVDAAAQTRVEFTGGALSIRSPKTRAWRFFGTGGSVDVTVRLPSGSRVDIRAGMADLRCQGRLGASRLDTSSGHITADALGGPSEVTTANGDVRIGEIDGTAVVKSSNGGVTVGTAGGDLRLQTAYGDFSVDRALAGLSARTAYGRIRIGEVVRGSILLETAGGDLEVGVREGTAAWVDAVSAYGRVTSRLEAAEGPGGSEETVEIRARTSYGDIRIHRA